MPPTTSEVAATLGCDKSTVTRAAKRYGIGRRVGPLLEFIAADIERLRGLINEGRGNPRIAQESARGVAARRKKHRAAKRAAKK